MEKIIVLDNFLSDNEIKILIEIIQKKSWTFGKTSDKLTENTNNLNTPYWSINLIDELYLTENILKIIEKYFLKKFTILRCYANAQSYGQDGDFHIDSSNKEKNEYTFVLYISDIPEKYIEAACGYIFFKFPELKYKICYEPKFNRGIFFPSDYIHKAHAFNRYIMDLRLCIAWKLKEK